MALTELQIREIEIGLRVNQYVAHQLNDEGKHLDAIIKMLDGISDSMKKMERFGLAIQHNDNSIVPRSIFDLQVVSQKKMNVWLEVATPEIQTAAFTYNRRLVEREGLDERKIFDNVALDALGPLEPDSVALFSI